MPKYHCNYFKKSSYWCRLHFLFKQLQKICFQCIIPYFIMAWNLELKYILNVKVLSLQKETMTGVTLLLWYFVLNKESSWFLMWWNLRVKLFYRLELSAVYRSSLVERMSPKVWFRSIQVTKVCSYAVTNQAPSGTEVLMT